MLIVWSPRFASALQSCIGPPPLGRLTPPSFSPQLPRVPGQGHQRHSAEARLWRAEAAPPLVLLRCCGRRPDLPRTPLPEGRHAAACFGHCLISPFHVFVARQVPTLAGETPKYVASDSDILVPEPAPAPVAGASSPPGTVSPTGEAPAAHAGHGQDHGVEKAESSGLGQMQDGRRGPALSRRMTKGKRATKCRGSPCHRFLSHRSQQPLGRLFRQPRVGSPGSDLCHAVAAHARPRLERPERLFLAAARRGRKAGSAAVCRTWGGAEGLSFSFFFFLPPPFSSPPAYTRDLCWSPYLPCRRATTSSRWRWASWAWAAQLPRTARTTPRSQALGLQRGAPSRQARLARRALTLTLGGWPRVWGEGGEGGLYMSCFKSRAASRCMVLPGSAWQAGALRLSVCLSLSLSLCASTRASARCAPPIL